MTIDLKQDVFPSTNLYSEDGWEVLVECIGTYKDFVFRTAQAGDPLGSVTLLGPDGIKLVMGQKRSRGWWRNLWRKCEGDTFPINLTHSGEIVYGLMGRLLNAYNIEMRFHDLVRLCMMALKPYNPHSCMPYYFKADGTLNVPQAFAKPTLSSN